MKSPPRVITTLAAQLAKNSTMKKKISCVIYTKKDVVATGVNRYLSLSGSKRTIKRLGIQALSIHAEMDALINALDDRVLGYENERVYVYRRNGLLARPCDLCMSTLVRAGISPQNIAWSG